MGSLAHGIVRKPAIIVFSPNREHREMSRLRRLGSSVARSAPSRHAAGTDLPPNRSLETPFLTLLLSKIRREHCEIPRLWRLGTSMARSTSSRHAVFCPNRRHETLLRKLFVSPALGWQDIASRRPPRQHPLNTTSTLLRDTPTLIQCLGPYLRDGALLW